MFRRSFSVLIATAVVVSGVSFLPVFAQETEGSEPVVAQETENSEPVVTQEAIPLGSEPATAQETVPLEKVGSDTDSDESMMAGPGEIFPAEDVQVSGNTYVQYPIRDKDDLVAVFGASNVSAKSDTEIKLLNDFDFPDTQHVSIDFYDCTFTFDFNGHRCNGIQSWMCFEGSDITLIDSSGSQSGGITSDPILEGGKVSSFPYPLSTYGGNLTIKSGYYDGYGTTIIATTGKILIQGGRFDSIEVAADMEKAEIQGGEFRSADGAVFCGKNYITKDGSGINPLQISGGTFSCTNNDPEYGAINYVYFGSEIYPDMGDLIDQDCFILPGKLNRFYEKDWTTARVFTEDNVKVYKNNSIEGFVYRLYSKALEREPDVNGFANWVTQLKDKKISGSGAAFGFFFSPELTNRNLSNEAFVTLLYNVFLNREPDAGGMQTWLSALETGASRKYVFSGFANSQEWKGLCEKFGIEPGSYTSDEPRDQNLQVTAFVQRLYSLCLNRKAEVDGLNNWTAALLSKEQDGAHVAYGFFFSQEFVGRNLSNAEYVEVLYKVLLGRNSDPAGKADWVKQLDGGMARMDIFRGFVHSQEFDQICADYGIVRGTI